MPVEGLSGMLNHLFLRLNLKMMGLEGRVYTWKFAKKQWVVTLLDESPLPQPLPTSYHRIFMFKKKKKKNSYETGIGKLWHLLAQRLMIQGHISSGEIWLRDSPYTTRVHWFENLLSIFSVRSFLQVGPRLRFQKWFHGLKHPFPMPVRRESAFPSL